MATAVFWFIVNGGVEGRAGGAYEPEGNDADDVHENVAAFAEDYGVERDERLGRAEGEERIGVRLRDRLVKSLDGRFG